MANTVTIGPSKISWTDFEIAEDDVAGTLELRNAGNSLICYTPSLVQLTCQITTNQLVFSEDHQLVSKKYVDGAVSALQSGAVQGKFCTSGAIANTNLVMTMSDNTSFVVDMSTLPFTNNYDNLINTPSLFDGNYSSLQGSPALFDGDYYSLQSRPALFDGKYSSLSDPPSFVHTIQGGDTDLIQSHSYTGGVITLSLPNIQIRDVKFGLDSWSTDGCTAIGREAARYAHSSNNPNFVAVGYQALGGILAAKDCTRIVAVGREAAFLSSAQDSIFIGHCAGRESQCIEVVAMGTNSMKGSVMSQSVCVGSSSGKDVTTSHSNTMIGHGAGDYYFGDGSIHIGCGTGNMRQNGINRARADNQTLIGNHLQSTQENTFMVGYREGANQYELLSGKLAQSVDERSFEIHCKDVRLNLETTQPANDSQVWKTSSGYLVQGDPDPIFDFKYSSLIEAPTLFDGDYNSLSNRPTFVEQNIDDLFTTDGKAIASFANENGQLAATSGAKNSLMLGIDACKGIETATGKSNIVAIGHRSMSDISNKDGTNMTSVGYMSAFAYSGSLSVIVGSSAGHTSAGDENVFVGSNAGKSITNTIGHSVCIGFASAEGTGANMNESVFLGHKSGYGAGTVTKYNTFCGTSSGMGSSNVMRSNTCIGESAGRSANMRKDDTVMGENTYIGKGAGQGSTGARNIYIGHEVGKGVTSSDSLRIGTIVEGDMLNGTFKINAGSVFMGTLPSQKPDDSTQLWRSNTGQICMGAFDAPAITTTGNQILIGNVQSSETNAFAVGFSFASSIKMHLPSTQGTSIGTLNAEKNEFTLVQNPSGDRVFHTSVSSEPIDGDFVCIAHWHHKNIIIAMFYGDNLSTDMHTGTSFQANGPGCYEVRDSGYQYGQGHNGGDGAAFDAYVASHNGGYLSSVDTGGWNADRWFKHQRVGNDISMWLSTDSASETDPDHSSWQQQATDSISAEAKVAVLWAERSSESVDTSSLKITHTVAPVSSTRLISGIGAKESADRKFEINAGHIEVDVERLPPGYSVTYPNRIWVHDGGLRVGALPAGTQENQTVLVTVAGKTGGGNAYFFGGVERDSLATIRGTTITFDTTDSTNDTHPFKLSSTNADSSSGTEYTDGVTYYINGSVVSGSDYVSTYSTGSASGFRGIHWTVPHTASTTYYYCTVHDGMGENGILTSTGPSSGTSTGTSSGTSSGISAVKNFDSAATTYNTNGDLSLFDFTLTSGTFKVLEHGVDSGNDSGTLITGWYVYRSSSYNYTAAWLIESGATPSAGNNPQFAITSPDGTNLLGLKDAKAEVTLTALVPNTEHILTFKAASKEGTDRLNGHVSTNLPTPVKVEWIGTNQSAETLTISGDITPPLLVSGNTGAAFEEYTYTITPTTTTGKVRLTASPIGGGFHSNNGSAAWITDLHVTSNLVPQQSDGEQIFSVTDGDKLNLMRIKGGANIDVTPSYGVMTVALALPTAYDSSNPNKVWLDEADDSTVTNQKGMVRVGESSGNLKITNALEFGDSTTLETFPGRVASKYLVTDESGVMSWGEGGNITNITYNRIASSPANTMTYTHANGSTYTRNAPNILDLNGINDSFHNKNNYTVRVNNYGLNYYDMTMVDRPSAAVEGQISLRASDNNISTYSLKTLRAGTGITITNNNNCLQIDATATGGTGSGGTAVTVATESEHVAQIDPSTQVLSFPTIKLTETNVGIGYQCFENASGSDNVAIGLRTGQNQTGSRNIFIGTDRGVDATSSDTFALGSANIALIEGTMGNTAAVQTFKINAPHVEMDVTNLPDAYSGDFPDRIWSDGGGLRVGSSAPDISVSTTLTTGQNVKSHITTDKVLADFTSNNELVSKEYVDSTVSASTLLALTDVGETEYTSQNHRALIVNSTGTGMEFGGVFGCDDSGKRINIGDGNISDMQNNTVAIGHSAGNLHINHSRENSCFVGVEAGMNTGAPVSGAESLSHDNCVCVGYRAGRNSDYMENTVIIGADAGYSSSMRPHSNTVLVGAFAGHNSGVDDQTTGNTYSSTHIGTFSGKNVRGLQNVAVGRDTLFHHQKESSDNTSNNLAIGNACMRNTKGSHNCTGGTGALRFDGSGRGEAQENTVMGYEALCTFTPTLRRNIAFGFYMMRNANACNDNIAIGFQTARFCSGDGNIVLGKDSFYEQSGDNNIVIGNGVLSSSGSDSNQLRIGTLLEGTLPNYAGGSLTGELRINAGHVEFDKDNAPTEYSSTYPDRIWVDGTTVRVGESTNEGSSSGSAMVDRPDITYIDITASIVPDFNGSFENSTGLTINVNGYYAMFSTTNGHATAENIDNWTIERQAGIPDDNNAFYIESGSPTFGGVLANEGNFCLGIRGCTLKKTIAVTANNSYMLTWYARSRDIGAHSPYIHMSLEVDIVQGGVATNEKPATAYGYNWTQDSVIITPTSSSIEIQFIASQHTNNSTLFLDSIELKHNVTNNISLRASDASATLYSLKTIKAGTNITITTPDNQDCLQINADAPDGVPFSQNSGKNSLYIGHDANYNSNSGNFNCCVGNRANYAVTSGGSQWNACFGASAGMYYMGQKNTFIGYAAGGGGSSSSGGQKVGEHNVMIGQESGVKSGGHRNIFIGSGTGKNQGSGDDRFKLGYYTYLMFDGKLPTGSTEGELLINAPTLKVDPGLKTEADYASLVSGQIYVDTQNGYVLKMKP